MSNVATDTNKALLLELTVSDDQIFLSSDVLDELQKAEEELALVDEQIRETTETIKNLSPECDKLDYALAASCGAISGVFDIFLVGKPGESPLGNITDKWVADKTMAFAKLHGWRPRNEPSLSSAIKHLETAYKIPYDQTGTMDTALSILDISTDNHHFKSLGHNPSLLGLFFSILDQFNTDAGRPTSHFVSVGELIALKKYDTGFELRGNDLSSKLFCAFVNWLGHLISDMSGSSNSTGRGKGIPSPLWTWTNDIIAIKRSLKIPTNRFDEYANELALSIYTKGYDERFQTAQAIPVVLNEMLVRTVFSVRRLIGFFCNTEQEMWTYSLIWESCEPFSNATVKRMLTVAHGTFCLVDAGEATVSGFAKGVGSFNAAEFFMRLNVVGVGRFTLSLYGEGTRSFVLYRSKKNEKELFGERQILEYYVKGLKQLADIYDNQLYLSLFEAIQNDELYLESFEASVLLAQKLGVSEEKLLKNKDEIDAYFNGG